MEDVKELTNLLETKVKLNFLLETLLSNIEKKSYIDKPEAFLANDALIINAIKATYPERLEKRLKELGIIEDKEVE